MNAPRRLTALPLPACLLRTTRRLTSSRFSPSGKSLPSSPLVLTTPRRFAPLTLLLIALLALGGVLLWSAPTEAQTTTRILVSNVGRGADDSVSTGGNAHAQLFHTAGATHGYTLTSVIVVSEDTQGDDFDVDICEVDSNEFPTSRCTALTRPGSFTAGNLEFTHPGLFLEADTDYTVVIKQHGSESVTLDSTTSGREDSTGLTGWSIKNKFDVKISGDWEHKSGSNEAIQITVNGYETTANTRATGRPVVLASAEGAGILFADTENIADANGLPIDTSNTWVFFNWTYQWVRVDGNTRTTVGGNSASYQPVAADVGKQIMVRVSYTDRGNFSETRTSLPFGPIVEPDPPPASKLVSNTGQSSATANITQQYALGFRLGDHGQGYDISSVSIDLAAAPSRLTVSLWSGGVDGALQSNTAYKLFDFANPSSLAVGLNKFTAPAGAFAYQGVNYFIVLSGFGSSLSIKQTTSNNEDAGGETGAVIYDDAAVRASATGRWSISDDRASVLRMAVEGSQRARGILAASYAQTPSGGQEIISVGDEIGLGGIELGAADRYLIRGVSFSMDNTTPSGSGFTNPLDLRSGSRTGAKQFSLTNTRKAPGLPVWTARQGATVVGGCTTVMSVETCKKYVFDMPVGQDGGPDKTRRRDDTLTRMQGAGVDGVDDPGAPGVSITGTEGDVAGITTPYMAVLGEPLNAMVQNLGQTDNGYVDVGGSSAKVVSQGFTTGSSEFGYRVKGIGVEIEGSGGRVPDGPTSVSVSVHAASGGKPGRKLFDLVSPGEYAAGHVFFEAPPNTHLARHTSVVLVWHHLRGTWHRLHRTTDNGEDSGAATLSIIADSYYLGADVNNLTEDSNSNALQIAVYAEANTEAPFVIVVPETEPETEGTFVPYQADGYIVRCSAPPAEHCPTYDTVAGRRPTVWSATLTVGQRPQATRLGYGNVQDPILLSYTPYGTLDNTTFTSNSTRYTIKEIVVVAGVQLELDLATGPGTDANKLTLHVGTQRFALADAIYDSNAQAYRWFGAVPSWSVGDTVQLKITGPPLPNAYGYRTIWTALMTAGQDANVTAQRGYSQGAYGEITNDLIVTGRDESIRVGTPDQPRYPWTGYEIDGLITNSTAAQLTLDFVTDAYPTADEVAGWTLTLGGGVELPFADVTTNPVNPWRWRFPYTSGLTAGDQVLVSIRNDEVQNRVGQTAGEGERAGEVRFKSRRNTQTDRANTILYGKTHFSYDHEPDKFGPADGWELRSLNVTTDKTGDTDPVWIRATFRTHGSGAAGRAWQGYWEGQFDDFHTLFLRWIYNEGGIGKGEVTYTLPLRSANGIWLSNFGRDVTFTWVRTYKEFERRHLDLANHADMSAHMLASPQPATARAGGEGGDGDTRQRQYVPTTVTSVDFTSNPGTDRVYGLGDTIQVTVAFSEDVTVVYDGSKKHAAEVDLEMGGQTRTAHYARTDGNRVIFEYTVVPGDEETFVLLLLPNSLRLNISGSETKNWKRHSWIRNSDGRDAVLDHIGLGSTAHRVDAVSPEFASAQVSSDGTQVGVSFNEGIKSPAIWRAFGVQTSLLQSLALDVRVDGELAALSDAAVSGDMVTLTMAEPVTQGQTVAVSYDNLFVETGESIFEDLYGNNLLTFTEQPATNGSTVADVERPDGGLALSRTDLFMKEGESGAYTVALASQPTSDVTVAIGQRPPGRATVSPASLTFTADNWNTPQTVTITSTEDANYVDRWVLLRHVATGDDYGASAAAWLILRDTYNVGTTPANNRATGSPTIGGTPQVDHTLTVDLSNIADADGLTHASYTWLYQWLRGGSEIRGATDSTYTLGLADAGKTIKVKVSFTDDANNQESRTSAPTVAIETPPNIQPTGVPTINGTPQVRRPLTVDTSEIADADGMEESVFLYQWLAKNSTVTLELAGEHNPTYTPSPAEEGFAIMVRVTFTDDRGHSETLTSAATVAVARPPNYEPTGLPAISGTPQVGETLTADTSAIDDADGLTNATFEYQWLHNQSVLDANTGTYYYINVDLPGETGSTYTLAPADKGRTFAVRVSFTDDRGNSESLTSRSTVVVAAKPNSEPTGLPAIDGTPQVGQTLTADTSAIDDADGLTTVSYEYRWFAIKTVVDENTGFSLDVISLLSGDTSSTYTLGPADAGYTFTVRVTFTDDEGNNESLTSEATEAVAATAPTAPQSLSVATGDQDQELDVTWQAPSSNGGSEVTGYKVQWKEAADSWDTAADVSQATETGTTYTITSLTGGVEYSVRVIATNDVGDGPASTEAKGTPAGGVSEQVVEPENSAPTGLPGISGTPQVDQTLTADTSPIDDEDGLTNVSYSYQWMAGGTDIDGATGASYTLTAGEQGQTIQVRVTFTDDADNEETLTSEATVAVAAAPNREATGLPLINGTPQVGETLTADTSAIVDEDGLTNVSYRYQWTAGGSDIAEATGSIYTMTASEQGQTIQVKVTFTDDRNNAETLTSVATVAVVAAPAPLTATVPVSPYQSARHKGADDRPQVIVAFSRPVASFQKTTPSVSLTGATVSSVRRHQEDGLENAWIFFLNPDDNDDIVFSLVTGQPCDSDGICTDDGRRLSSAVQTTLPGPDDPNSPATGAPAISGTPQVEQTLTANTSAIQDADGLQNVSYQYQWLAAGTAISGATGSSYTLTANEQGDTIQVRVSFNDDKGNAESRTSVATDAVAAKPVPLTANFSNVPDSHDGSTEFTFDLTFSENFELSYVTLRDHAFTKDEQNEDHVVAAQRKVPGSNQTWTITVKPPNNGAITITLPVTTDCTVSGAICTDDGRMLSNSNSVSISGPQ